MQIIRRAIKRWLIAAATRLFRRANIRSESEFTKLRLRAPNKLLLANIGHLGDAVISSALLPVIKNAWPEVRIGLLVGSWSRHVFEGHPLVFSIHTFDHWALNRSEASFAKKLWKWIETRRIAEKEIRNTNYDVAVDLRCIFPNSAALLRNADVPVRIAYDRLGIGGLLTHPIRYAEKNQHEQAYQLDLIRPLIADPKALSHCKQSIHIKSSTAAKEVDVLLNFAALGNRRYRVVHIGSGAPEREWSPENWRTLAKTLIAEGHTLVFSGAGNRECGVIDWIIDGLPGCINACHKLSWSGFLELIRGAELVYGVESLSGHLAATFDVPSVSVYSGIGGTTRWSPVGKKAIALTNDVPCAPCGLKHGCKEMQCVAGVTVNQVIEAGDELVGKSSR